MRIEIDEDQCVGAGQCVMSAPDVFDQRLDDGTAFVVDDDPPAVLHDDVRAAAQVCPAAAITVEG